MKHRKLLAILLLAAMMLTLFAGCKKTTDENATKLSFRSAASYDYLKTLDGKTVTISGYMATSSPVDGSFLFLMNLPYQSCPFCVPNTSQLSNTMEVYPKKGEAFGYTAQAIKVVGTLQVADDPNKPFTDEYGYEFNYKIVDATYTVIQASELSEEMALWQKIAEADVVSDIYAMYEYVNFLCAWNTYFVNSYTDADGNKVPGYYLYASDAEYFIKTEGAQYNYGYKDGYFEGIINKIASVDPDAFQDLISNVLAAKSLAQKALAELEAGNYTYEEKYLEEFGSYDDVYTLDKGEELAAEMEKIYTAFSDWLGSWEM